MNGTDVGLMFLVLAVVFVAVEYYEWSRRDQDRREDRKVKRNLERMVGEWRP